MTKSNISLFALALLAYLVPAPTKAQSKVLKPRMICQVVNVHDGDTLTCSNGTKVRLLLIDTPELNQKPFGQEAGNHLRLIALNKTVWLETDLQPMDRYGRLLAYVWTRPDGGRMINVHMVAQGLALVLSYPPNIRYIDEIRAAADRAKATKAGLWALNGFECTPKDHRAKRC